MSFEGESRLNRYMKLFFGFSPLKFLCWYIVISWIILGDISNDCIFNDTYDPTVIAPNEPILQSRPQHKRGSYIIFELFINLIFLVLFFAYSVYFIVMKIMKKNKKEKIKREQYKFE